MRDYLFAVWRSRFRFVPKSDYQLVEAALANQIKQRKYEREDFKNLMTQVDTFLREEKRGRSEGSRGYQRYATMIDWLFKCRSNFEGPIIGMEKRP